MSRGTKPRRSPSNASRARSQKPRSNTLREIGVTRLSFGVEHFDDTFFAKTAGPMNRPNLSRWPWIHSAGFANMNIDLIAGMVGDTWDKWRETVRRTIELEPDSVTIYQMELPFNTVYSKDILGGVIETPVADWPKKRAWVDYAFDELAAAGYSVSSAYTMVETPRVNFSYRDNLWRGSDLFATGIASFGHVSGVHYQNHPEWEPYCGAWRRASCRSGADCSFTAPAARA